MLDLQQQQQQQGTASRPHVRRSTHCTQQLVQREVRCRQQMSLGTGVLARWVAQYH
jgi:hypothetical protein